MHSTADTNGEMRIRIKDLNNRWETLNGTVHETLKNVEKKDFSIYLLELFCSFS
jgi:hypothetical protein